MNDDPAFDPPEITDEDIRRASGLLDLPDYAFYGQDGTDPRQDVLKSMEQLDVPACPGSGKTTLLVAKLAILAEKWKDGTRGVCVLSHTNAARHQIETRLDNTAERQRLLAYPHFIGTIHKFANEFLALPWLRCCGYPIKMIDTEICERRRWKRLSHNCQYFLKQKRMDESSVRIVDADFNFAKTSGKLPFGDHTETYRNVQSACRETAREGYHCYDDMFIWGRDLIVHVPEVVAVLRDRFPMLFLDEAQDNSEEQSALLHDVFTAGDAPVICQRFGDPNQAIFNFVGAKGATTHKFPDENIPKIDLPNSHRFGPNIAQLAGPLGVTQHAGGLIGQGPSTHRLARQHEGRHTIFLFDDDGAGKVLDAYAALLIETFSQPELLKGSFVAVGQVHKPKGDDKKPRHVGHYWPSYDSELTGIDPKPRSFVQYVSAGQRKAAEVREAHPAVERIAEGILRLAGMAEGGTTLRRRRNCHRYVLQLLEESVEIHECYEDLVNEFALTLDSLTQEPWDNRWRAVVREIARAIAQAPLSEEAKSFLNWDDERDFSGSAAAIPKSRANIYCYPKDNPKVRIRVDSIHSVKGATHTATLVLETFWQDRKGQHNLELLLPWLHGNKSGGESAKKYQTSRLKLHYVAMTRPTHLLCLAMKRSTFEDKTGGLDNTRIKKLKGWTFKVL